MRETSIDDFRGFSIFLMLLANFMHLLNRNLPLLLSHGQPGKALPLDMVAPLFGFAIGLSLPFTLRSSMSAERSPWRRTGRRVLLLFLIGYIPNYIFLIGRGLDYQNALFSTWGTLETWALSYLFVILLLFLPLKVRLAAFFFFPLLYQAILLDVFPFIKATTHLLEGGPVAVLSWSLLPAAGSICGELLLNKKDTPSFLKTVSASGAALIALGLSLHFLLWPMDRISVNASFIYFSLGVSALCYVILYTLPRRKSIFRSVGESPLLAWVMQGLVYIPYYYIAAVRFTPPIGVTVAFFTACALFIFTAYLRRLGVSLKV